MTSCSLSFTPSPFWKGVYSKSKEFAPWGSKVFPFIVDIFSERRQNDLVASPESVSIPLKRSNEDIINTIR